MNNYQLNLLNRGKFEFVSELGNENIEFKESLVLHQNENYKIVGYKIIINNSMVDCVLYKNEKYQATINGVIEIPFCFDKPGSEIVLTFKGGIADDCSLTLSVVLSNHEEFDIKTAKENQEQLNKSIALTLTIGNSLINIYCKKANDSVVKTIIKLLFSVDGNIYLVDEIESDKEFNSKTGLGYGLYECCVEQYDSNCKLIASSTKSIVLENEINKLRLAIEASLKDVENQVKASGNHTVCW